MRLSWIAAPVIAGAVALAPNPAAAEASPAGATLRSVNVVRAQHGLPKLRANGSLARAAAGHNRAMIRTRTFAHEVPGEPALRQRVRRSGYGAGRWQAGEVLTWGAPRQSPSAAVQAWLGSPGHRAIILDGRYRTAGVAVARRAPAGGAGTTYTMNVGTR
jgi:uncharacterized protein YkwD